MRKGARLVATELLREPVKQAVREALREEIASSESSSGKIEAHATHESESSGERSRESSKKKESSDSSSGGRSKVATLGLVLAIVGVTYLARKRMSSTSGTAWSEPSAGSVATDDAEGGYVSEGEMQTAETADESTSGASQSTTSSQ